MTGRDMGSLAGIRPSSTYGVAETAALLGVPRTSLYKHHKGLKYLYDVKGHRVYTGYSILCYMNTFTDPETGEEVTVDPNTGETIRPGRPSRRAKGM